MMVSRFCSFTLGVAGGRVRAENGRLVSPSTASFKYTWCFAVFSRSWAVTSGANSRASSPASSAPKSLSENLGISCRNETIDNER